MNANSHHACHVVAPEPAAEIPNDELTNDPRTIRLALEHHEAAMTGHFEVVR